MKKTTSFSLLTMLFLLLFTGGSSNVWAEDIWVKTDPTALQTGDVVAIADLTRGLVMPNDKGTASAPNAVAISFNDEKTEISVTVEAAWQWVVTVDGTGADATFQFNVAGTENYLYCTNANNGVRVGTNENNVFKMQDEFLFNVGQSRYIGPYQTQDWRCYTSINNNIQGTVIAFFKKTENASAVERPVISPAGGVFSEAQTVTLTSEGNTIYYTLDGTDPTNASTLYEAPFTVSSSCIVKAVAYDSSNKASSVASADFKILEPITTIAELCAAATETDEPAIVQFNNWVCSGVAGGNAYFTDGTHGILLYQNGHNFVLGDKLSGIATITLTTYNETPEIKGLTKTTEGVTVEAAGEITPIPVVVSDLQKNMQGCVISLEGVTYDAAANAFIDDDDNKIVPYNRFITLPTLLDGKTYNVTGVAIWFKNNQVWEIAPRSEEEFVLVTSQVKPESSWNVEELIVDVNDEVNAVFTTNSDGVVTYTSSNEEVATIDEAGNITLVSNGTAVITAAVAETETYLADSKSITIVVTKDGYADVTFAFNDADLVGQGATDVGAPVTATRLGILTLYMNRAYDRDGNDHIKVYGSSTDEDKGPSQIELSVTEGYVITKVVLTATNADYIKSWKEEFANEVIVNEATATWEGDRAKVTLTNQATSQARITTIAVTFVDLNKADAISMPTSVESEGFIYNLAGQRLSKMQKGINIVGGKKVLK